MEAVILFVGDLELSLLVRKLVFEPGDLLIGLFLVKLRLVKVAFQVFLLERSLLLHHAVILAHFELHSVLHDLFVLQNHLVLGLLELLVAVADLRFKVRNLSLQLIIVSLDLSHLFGILLA